MFKKLFTKKGSAEIVSIVLAIVIIGGLAVAIIGNLSTNTKTFYEKGLDKQNRDVETVYTDVFEAINVVPPNLDGNGSGE